jgi:hypothetical protein
MPQFCSSPIKFEESRAFRADPSSSKSSALTTATAPIFGGPFRCVTADPTPAGQRSFEKIGAVDPRREQPATSLAEGLTLRPRASPPHLQDNGPQKHDRREPPRRGSANEYRRIEAGEGREGAGDVSTARWLD